MLFCKRLALILAIAAMAVPLGARTRKGDKLWNQGKQEERRKNWDAALALYEKALSEDPADAGYQLSTNRARFQAAQYHVDQGQKLRAAGELAQALTAFEYAYAIDPASSVAEQEIQRTRAMIERERRREAAGEPVNKEERKLTAADIAKLQTLEKIDRIQAVPELKPFSTQPINLKMNNQPPKVLFETLGKVAGINVLFDPDFTQGGGRNQSVEFNNSTIEESLDHVSVLTKSFWKPLSSNAIFVTQDNTTKRRDYEEQVVKVFYLTNVNTPQELQEIATNIRGICDIRRLFTYNAQMAIIVRAEADRVALAEKVIADLDKPKSEVVIDVLVLEVSKTKERDLAISASPSGFSSPGTYGPVSETTTDNDGTSTSTSTGAQRVRLGNYSFLLPIPKLEAVMQDRSTR
ncbi:MAG: hypothetical protein L0219_10970, partial [Phycisphaerales bacterium]|nr:hypothetical protein [Phycisphaerales bacterium]